jgi:hypothetical protein
MMTRSNLRGISPVLLCALLISTTAATFEQPYSRIVLGGPGNAQCVRAPTLTVGSLLQVVPCTEYVPENDMNLRFIFDGELIRLYAKPELCAGWSHSDRRVAVLPCVLSDDLRFIAKVNPPRIQFVNFPTLVWRLSNNNNQVDFESFSPRKPRQQWTKVYVATVPFSRIVLGGPEGSECVRAPSLTADSMLEVVTCAEYDAANDMSLRFIFDGDLVRLYANPDLCAGWNHTNRRVSVLPCVSSDDMRLIAKFNPPRIQWLAFPTLVWRLSINNQLDLETFSSENPRHHWAKVDQAPVPYSRIVLDGLNGKQCACAASLTVGSPLEVVVCSAYVPRNDDSLRFIFDGDLIRIYSRQDLCAGLNYGNNRISVLRCDLNNQMQFALAANPSRIESLLSPDKVWRLSAADNQIDMGVFSETTERSHLWDKEAPTMERPSASPTSMPTNLPTVVPTVVPTKSPTKMPISDVVVDRTNRNVKEPNPEETDNKPRSDGNLAGVIGGSVVGLMGVIVAAAMFVRKNNKDTMVSSFGEDMTNHMSTGKLCQRPVSQSL